MSSLTLTARNLLSALNGTAKDVVSRTFDPEWHELLLSGLALTPGALRHALPWLIKARPGHDASLLTMALAHADRSPNELALEMRDERLSWRDLAERSGRVAHVLAQLGVKKGDVVALIGMNSPTYLAIVLGATHLGAVTALVNWHLEGAPLEHAITSARARVVLVEATFAERVADLGLEHVLTYGPGELDERLARVPSRPPPRTPIDTADDFVYIYTSGTTGLPKPCRVTHGRALMAGAGFGSLLFRYRPGDKLYCVLPLYHSSALLIGAGSCIMQRVPLALRESFSASAFWEDVARYRATAMLYIGELCRYLVNRPPHPAERDNTIRVAVGNGLRADVWQRFSDRFDIPEIREFYSATEAPGAIFNFSGKVGSIGHVPLRRFSALQLARYDVSRDELMRDDRGFAIRCEPGEVGQLVIRLKDKPATPLGEFRGYTDERATRSKIARDLFEPGDRYFLSGDLMRFDTNDYFYFVDRIGDTYRWKGENVSTEEVAEIVAQAPGVEQAAVTGISVPGHEGQAGLAALVCRPRFDPDAFWNTAQQLPSYAQPRFVRILESLSTTGTFKIKKSDLRREGINPTKIRDPLYVRQDTTYLPLTPARYQALLTGTLRL